MRGPSVSSEEAEGSIESSGLEREEESCVWRGSEEEAENWDDSISSVTEDKEMERGTKCLILCGFDSRNFSEVINTFFLLFKP